GSPCDAARKYAALTAAEVILDGANAHSVGKAQASGRASA
ncbi:hypothetical protein ABIF78_010760, partial [Bradyrhizobium japonicum]